VSSELLASNFKAQGMLCHGLNMVSHAIGCV
jgi:hypothetical protein